MALIITDLDNTLYDWVAYYARSFRAMSARLSELLEVEEERVLSDFRTVHQRYGNSEQPFAILELECVARAFGRLSRAELAERLAEPMEAFNEARSRFLRLYDTVAETLAEIQRLGHVIVGHTEAIQLNSHYRLVKLGIDGYFARLYTLGGTWKEHPHPHRPRKLSPAEGFIETIPPEERKPNPELLRDICRREGFPLDDAIYVGDSLTRDIAMARAAGVHAVWARYGTRYDPDLWQTLVRITHWTEEDVRREERLRETISGVEPDFTIDAFAGVLDVLKTLELRPTPLARAG
jgi:FMN phosphatase YigB (HAD superfamily)